jgi:putative heme-binding domain-containing protein
LTGLILGRDATQGGKVLAQLLPMPEKPAEAWQKQGLVDWLAELDRRSLTLEKWLSEDTTLRARWETVANTARAQTNVSAEFISFLGRDAAHLKADYALLLRSLERPLDAAAETAVFNRLRLLKLPDTAERLFALWPKFGPARRELVINLLLGRTEWTAALLTAGEQGTVARQEISPTTQTRLLRLTNTPLQQRAQSLFSATRNPDRAAVIARYAGVADLKGDVTRGAALFTQNCASCHALNGTGHAVGPDITLYRNKPVADFLAAILDPNAVIEPRFIAYNIEAKDDRSLTGLIAAENADSLTLIGGNGVRETVHHTEVISLKASSFSLMPEGMEQAISPQGMADLIAYLKSGN